MFIRYNCMSIVMYSVFMMLESCAGGFILNSGCLSEWLTMVRSFFLLISSCVVFFWCFFFLAWIFMVLNISQLCFSAFLLFLFLFVVFLFLLHFFDLVVFFSICLLGCFTWFCGSAFSFPSQIGITKFCQTKIQPNLKFIK